MKKTLMIALVLAVSAGVLAPNGSTVPPAAALDCPIPNHGDLTLVSVTEDGIPLADRSAYAGSSVRLWARDKAVNLEVSPQHTFRDGWLETYHAADTGSR